MLWKYKKSWYFEDIYSDILQYMSIDIYISKPCSSSVMMLFEVLVGLIMISLKKKSMLLPCVWFCFVCVCMILQHSPAAQFLENQVFHHDFMHCQSFLQWYHIEGNKDHCGWWDVSCQLRQTGSIPRQNISMTLDYKKLSHTVMTILVVLMLRSNWNIAVVFIIILSG